MSLVFFTPNSKLNSPLKGGRQLHLNFNIRALKFDIHCFLWSSYKLCSVLLLSWDRFTSEVVSYRRRYKLKITHKLLSVITEELQMDTWKYKNQILENDTCRLCCWLTKLTQMEDGWLANLIWTIGWPSDRDRNIQSDLSRVSRKNLCKKNSIRKTVWELRYTISLCNRALMVKI